MPRIRKKKTPITGSNNATQSASRSKGRTIIRRFHVLLKEQARLQSSSLPQDVKTLVDVEREINELGGLETYQRMSALGQGKERGGGSEKVLIQWLKELGINRKVQDDGSKLKLLEVGALKHDNYSACSKWIDPTPLDLRSRHPGIVEQDFLLMDENEHREHWDAISLSLVLNFVPEPVDRGRMLRLAHTMLVPCGFLFLALPLPCILNSRYLTPEHLATTMSTVGYREIKSRWKAGGKMAYWLYVKEDARKAADTPSKKVALRQGNRNNFSILI